MEKLIIIIVSFVMAGCASTRHLPQTVERTTHDTLYQNSLQYDSIYIDNRTYTYREADTVYREKIRYEYKYKYLRDTVRIHKVDSIPEIMKVETVKEVQTTPWYSKFLACLGIILLLVYIVFNNKKLIQ